MTKKDKVAINNYKPTKEEMKVLLVGSALFNAVFPYIKTVVGKREKKKIAMSMKKVLATYRTKMDRFEYLKIVNDSIDLTLIAREKSRISKNQEEAFKLFNIGGIFRALRFKYKELYTKLEINDKDVDDLLEDTGRDEKILESSTFVNRLVEEIDNYVNLDYVDTRTFEDIAKEINTKTETETIKTDRIKDGKIVGNFYGASAAIASGIPLASAIPVAHMTNIFVNNELPDLSHKVKNQEINNWYDFYSYGIKHTPLIESK